MVSGEADQEGKRVEWVAMVELEKGLDEVSRGDVRDEREFRVIPPNWRYVCVFRILMEYSAWENEGFVSLTNQT